MIRHHQERALRHADPLEVGEDRVARLAGRGRDIVHRDDQRVRVHGAGARGGLGGAVSRGRRQVRAGVAVAVA